VGRKSREKQEFRAEIASELRRAPSRSENIRWGLGWGLAMAAAFSIYVIILSFSRGSFYFEQYDTSAWTIVGAYVVAGSVAGVLAGLLRGLKLRRSSVVGSGVVIGIVVYGIIGIVMIGLRWSSIIPALIAGPIVGGILGWRWSDPNDPGRALDAQTRRIDAMLRVNERHRKRRSTR
jgi:hypothetical protein